MSENTGSAKAAEEQMVVEKKSSGDSKKRKQAVDPSLNMGELRELADLVIEHGFTDFEFENENIRVRLSKMSSAPIVQNMVPSAAATPPPPTGNIALTTPPEPLSVEDEDAGLLKIVSPIVGTVYMAPGPDKDPYVGIGSKVSLDTTVCIVEAMKLMNEIQAEVSGEIVKIYVENGQPVEYGQPLFGIRK